MELLKKWLDGSINWKEEKQVRNQAQENSFLADALEGLDGVPDIDHAQNVQILEQRLLERISKKDKVAYPFRTIAAAAILLLSTGIWWNMQSDLNQPTIAENKIQPIFPPSSPLMESNTPEYNTKASIQNTVAPISEKLVEEKKKSPAKQKAISTKELAVVQKELPSMVLSSDLQGDALSTDIAQEKVEMITEASTIVAVETPQEKIEMISEASTIVMEKTSQEADQMEEADGIAIIEEGVAADPAPTSMATESKIRSPFPPERDLRNAIVADPETGKKRTTLGELPDNSQVSPVDGMKAFQNYIKKNRRYPETANVKGTVFLVFTLKKNGAIKDVVVTKSLHPTYDEEAIRLLKEGPKWISPTKIGYCEISFGLED